MSVGIRLTRLGHWLFLLAAAYAVVANPVHSAERSCLLVSETAELSKDVEDCEFDKSLDLIASLTAERHVVSPRCWESAADKSVAVKLILAATHFQRGPPAC